MAQLAFYKGEYGNFWDKFICLVTRSKYSHIEVIFDNYRSWSSSPRDGGVRQIIFDHTNRWDLLECPSISEKLFIQEKGKKYDWTGLLAPVFQIEFFSAKDKWFCSEIVAEALGLSDSWRYTPQDLFNMYKPA